MARVGRWVSWKRRRRLGGSPVTSGPTPGEPHTPSERWGISYVPQSSVLEPTPEPPPPPPPPPYDELADALEERAAIKRLLRGERS